MQKPEYFKIYLPISRLDVTPQVEQFFKRIKSDFAEVIFSEHRQRKQFKYKIDNSELQKLYTFHSRATQRYYVLTFRKFINR